MILEKFLDYNLPKTAYQYKGMYNDADLLDKNLIGCYIYKKRYNDFEYNVLICPKFESYDIQINNELRMIWQYPQWNCVFIMECFDETD